MPLKLGPAILSHCCYLFINLCINLIPKIIIIQFSYLGLCLGVETVFSHLLQQIAKIRGLKKITFPLNIYKWSASFIITILDKDVCTSLEVISLAPKIH